MQFSGCCENQGKTSYFRFSRKKKEQICVISKKSVFHVFNYQYFLTLTYLLYSESAKRVIFRPPTQEKSDDDSFVPPLPDYDPILPPSGFKNNSRKKTEFAIHKVVSLKTKDLTKVCLLPSLLTKNCEIGFQGLK